MARKPETVRIELLGGFRVSVGARIVREDGWRLKKARSLLKLLALVPNHQLHREQVIELLWPELDQKAAANNLRQALHVARRTLEPDPAIPSGFLSLRDERLVLCPEGQLWVDVEAFEEAAAIARRTREPLSYRAAIDLYAGDLLPEDRYEGWAEDRREGLRQSYFTLLLELARLYEEREDFEPAIEALELLVQAELAHEEAHVGLMRLYARSGRRQEAMLRYERLRKTLSEELGMEPGEASRRLYEQIRVGGLRNNSQPKGHTPVPTSSVPEQLRRHNLPTMRTSFVGREREMIEVERLLVMTRLLTLTGAGGSGKTRFALAMAKNLVGAYPDGVWFVELAPLSEDELVPPAVARALGVREQPGRLLSAVLKDHLSSKKLLLVLDNCEHLVDAAARLVETLLDSCPGLRILATSREALNVSDELVWSVPPLSVPGLRHLLAVEDLARFESVQLFVKRARYRQPTFALSPQNFQAVARICRQLDGIPLAIELAAAKVGALSVEQIATRLKDSLKLLIAGSRTAEPRQRTLRGTLDWSYELLSEPERALFAQLSVFVGGWTLEAAEAVGAGSGIGEESVLELLLSLVDKSLVVVEAGQEDEPRYRMLEPVRQYGQERLQASGEAGSVRRRHAAFFLEVAEEAQPKLKSGRQVAWLERLEREHDNLRAALSWALEIEDAELELRLAEALGVFWHVRGHLSEGRRWLERGLVEGGNTPASVRAKALYRAGWIATLQGDGRGAMALLEESLSLYKELGDKTGGAISLANLGWTAVHYHGDRERLAALREEAEALRRKPLDRRTITHLLNFLALAALDEEDYERAVGWFEESLTLNRELGDTRGIAMCLSILGMLALISEEPEQAAALFEESLRLVQKPGDKVGVAYNLLGLAGVAAMRGEPARAARLWGAEEALREAIDLVSISSLVQSRYDYEGRLAGARAKLDETAWRAAWSEGRNMTLEQAMEYALSKEEPRTTAPEEPPVVEPTATLTHREREIALLVAQELTNRQIASELIVSEHTVATHVRKILKKLGLRSRTQIAAWAIEQQLLP